MSGAPLLGAGPVRQDHNQRQRSEEDYAYDKCRKPADVLVRVPVILVLRQRERLAHESNRGDRKYG